MDVLKTKQELREFIEDAQGAIGFVPTMGALHEGHLSLVRDARAANDTVIVSVFVNPTQFGPEEDFDRYPRTLEEDCELLRTHGVDAVFAPTAAEMYDGPDPLAAQTKVLPGDAARLWEGALRPGHFEGVCLVVSKLFNLVRPMRAYFGEKDFQQLAVISAMVRDLDMGIEIVGCPIVREDSGLALSSRNSNFTDEQRQKAAEIFLAMQVAATLFEQGERSVKQLSSGVANYLTKTFGSDIKIGYVAIVDAYSLQPLDVVEPDSRLIVSVELFGIHLIDNMAI